MDSTLPADLPATRAEAKRLGAKYYYTAKPCKHGHVASRCTSNGSCMTCFNQRRQTPEYKAKASETAKNWYNTPEGKSSIYAAVVKYQATERGQETKRRALRKFFKTPHAKAKRAEYHARRLREDPQYAIQFSLRTRFAKALKRNQQSGSAVQDLGCTISEFKSYCESHPNWEAGWTWADLGKKFQLDHIKALGLFDLTNFEQQLQAVHYTNLQPLRTDLHQIKTIEDNRLIRLARR